MKRRSQSITKESDTDTISSDSEEMYIHPPKRMKLDNQNLNNRLCTYREKIKEREILNFISFL